ncbi:glycosyltransferase family 2 protein [Vreelandella titanicae]|uniref:glycosyltransferase family 2 protein n=1 Tax=Vreelandella titanicae TaxID=664683 RepID=UPI003D272EB0
MDSYLKKGNECFQKKKYAQSISFYEKSLGKYVELDDLLKINISLSKKRLALSSKSEYFKNIYFNYIVRLGNDLGEESAKQYYPTEEVGRVNESDPLVSIIMPTWNRGYVIAEAIASVLDQTYKNWELLICDDASSDNTQEVVDSFNDKRIYYSKLEKTNGAVARNHGLKTATGDVYAFLDSDNIWSPNYLEEIVKAHSNTDTAIVYTAFLDTQVSNDKFISVDKKYKEFSYLDIAHRNYIDLNTVSLKPCVYLELGGFDPNLPRQQDWDLLVRYTSHYIPLGIDKPLVLYRRNADWEQVTTTKKHIDTREVILNKNKELAEKYKAGKLPKDIAIESLSNKIGKKPSTIAIKISAPNEKVAFAWGDYHFAHQLGTALYKHGWKYKVHCQDKWYEDECDVNIILRGAS